MKINDIGRVGAVQAYQQANKVNNSKKAEIRKDNLQISREGQELLKAQKSDVLNPAHRQEKVDAIREQVQTGTYQVDARAVAGKLIEEQPWLLGK